MGKARGKWYYYKGIPTIVTYHPSYLLRKPDAKREVWEDLQMLMKEMGLKPPERKGTAPRSSRRPGPDEDAAGERKQPRGRAKKSLQFTK